LLKGSSEELGRKVLTGYEELDALLER